MEKSWKCPKCGREFKRKNQSHYCGEKPKNIEEYIMSQDEEKQEDLNIILKALRAVLSETEERMSWSMPTFWKKRNIVQFAASKKHIGFYVGAETVENFKDDLSKYKTNKGTIQIPYGNIDTDLVSRVAKWCLEKVK